MLSVRRREELIEGLVRQVNERGMVAPAILFLEAHKPLSFLASQLLLLSQPTLEPFLGGVVREYALLLEDRQNVETILSRLEGLRR
ncbi:MAG: hypothetical protein MUP04_07250 [Anaerolineae bacterium]|nr:hypothetical protein [Anaerolineae bacterium]